MYTPHLMVFVLQVVLRSYLRAVLHIFGHSTPYLAHFHIPSVLEKKLVMYFSHTNCFYPHTSGGNCYQPNFYNLYSLSSFHQIHYFCSHNTYYAPPFIIIRPFCTSPSRVKLISLLFLGQLIYNILRVERKKSLIIRATLMKCKKWLIYPPVLL